MRRVSAFSRSLLAILFMAGLSTAATPERSTADEALAVSQAAVGREVDGSLFLTGYGEPMRLSNLGGKPLVVSFIYTSCHHVCPLITRNLASTVAIAREALGDDAFNVVSIGFDWAVDTPDRMRMFAASQGIKDHAWHFLSGDEAAVTALTENLGFLFWPSAKGFDHLTQTTIIDASGRVYRQVYGEARDATAIVEPLKEIVFDTPGDAGLLTHWVDRFRLFCTVFDPNSGRYRFDYSILMTVLTGVLSLGAVAFFIVHEWRKS